MVEQEQNMGITFKAVLVGAAISLAALVHADPSHAQACSELMLFSGSQDDGEGSRIEKLLDANPRMAEAGTVLGLIDG
jgi:hypothetical protein